MKQIIQDIKNGETLLEEVPAPQIKSGSVLIKTTTSLVSLGTERMLVEFGKAGYIEKARQQPDKVKQVLDKIKTDGLVPTIESVFNKLNQPLPLGYCNVGRVMSVGKGVTTFQEGDRVASNGNHAEFVVVPENLVAKIPDNVTDEEAAFMVIGAIGLQGIRLANPTLGETIVVIGLGLIGLITSELLKANGCRVIGIDFDEQKNNIARSKGIIVINPAMGDNAVKGVLDYTNGLGADAIIITASAKSDDIIHEAAEMSRKRGRIVLVGVIGLNLRRADFFEKELTFQVSCSYGPGRYDENYEQKGHDYPYGFVRWTEKRNFEAVLHALSEKQIDVHPLITERVPLVDYNVIYGDMRKIGSIASLLIYPEDSKHESTVSVITSSFKAKDGMIGIIGAGNFASSTIIPALKKAGAHIKYIASAKGLTAKILAKKAGATYATSDYHEMLNDPEIALCIITTRHDLHSRMVVDSLKAGKHTFVEKPLALNQDQLDQILEAYNLTNQTNSASATLTIGFNRRFAPLAVKMKQLSGNGPKNIIATMNAGFIPANVWVHDLEIGGGRIIGEACHYIDLCSFLTGSRVTAICMNALGSNPDERTDNASILLKYENGSNAVINYFSNGSKAYSKERIELFSQEKTLILDNWRSLTGYGTKGFSKMKTAQDKGHKAQFALLNDRIKNGGEALIPIDEIVNSTKASFAAIKSMKEGCWVEVS
jgi:predicted dehydrogenase/threonine dehydrogenase-like Zn-dependent dehydrogenase